MHVAHTRVERQVLVAYVSVNGMRSTRFPLQGLGCGCGVPSPISGLGQDAAPALAPPPSVPVPGEERSMTPLLVVGGIGAFLFWKSQQKKIEANRRRRRMRANGHRRRRR